MNDAEDRSPLKAGSHTADDDQTEADWGLSARKTGLSNGTKIGLSLVAVFACLFGVAAYRQLRPQEAPRERVQAPASDGTNDATSAADPGSDGSQPSSSPDEPDPFAVSDSQQPPTSPAEQRSHDSEVGHVIEPPERAGTPAPPESGTGPGASQTERTDPFTSNSADFEDHAFLDQQSEPDVSDSEISGTSHGYSGRSLDGSTTEEPAGGPAERIEAPVTPTEGDQHESAPAAPFADAPPFNETETTDGATDSIRPSEPGGDEAFNPFPGAETETRKAPDAQHPTGRGESTEQSSSRDPRTGHGLTLPDGSAEIEVGKRTVGDDDPGAATASTGDGPEASLDSQAAPWETQVVPGERGRVRNGAGEMAESSSQTPDIQPVPPEPVDAGSPGNPGAGSSSGSPQPGSFSEKGAWQDSAFSGNLPDHVSEPEGNQPRTMFPDSRSVDTDTFDADHGPSFPGGSSADDSGAEVYAVQPGDNYWRISQKVYGTARYFRALARYNQQRIPDPKTMRPGMEIQTPNPQSLQARYPDLFPQLSESLSREPQASGADADKPSGFFRTQDGQPMYRVGKDDTLSEIAQKHLGRSARWIQIYELNRDRLPNPDNLSIGTELRLPADAAAVELLSSPPSGR